ncbi:MAG: hypothetical protein AAFP81_18550, partial [Pseudomonadota bacterium]
MQLDTKKISPKQIRAIEDTQVLQDLLDRLDSEIDTIEVQLEFPDEDVDVDWERSAKAALGWKRGARKIAQAKLSRLQSGEFHEAKRHMQARRQADAQKELLAAERRKVQEIHERTAAINKASKIHERRLDVIEKLTQQLMSFDFKSAFFVVAKKQLDKETFNQMAEEANDKIARNFVSHIKNAGLAKILEPFDE